MTLSPDALTHVQRLSALTRSLEQLLQEAQTSEGPAAADALAIVSRYLSILDDGLHTASMTQALRGANLLTTVNKGLGDAAWTGRRLDVTSLGKSVSDEAIATAAALRAAT